MNQNSGNSTEKDVDLFYLIKKIGKLIDRIGFYFYRLILFAKRNIVILLILLAVGIGGGYLLDSLKTERYRHEIIVVPNYGSTPYLYEYVDGMTYKNALIEKVEIEPIINVYEFVKERYQNMELIKQFSLSNVAFAKYEKNAGVEQYYRYHLLTIYTNEVEDANLAVNQFLSKLNEDPYFLNRQKVEIENTSKTIDELNLSIDNINNILGKFSTSESRAGEVNIDNYSELNELVSVKKNIAEDLSRHKIIQLEQQKVIYDTSRILNIRESQITYKYILPLLLIFGFFGVVCLKRLASRYETYKSGNHN
ncbi:MAG: hypothetical protein GX159_07500 [Flavobacteriaceae bacterium]|jgi:hypothetical protein|nr:hypothetical protein [Flavobacteriaceae bacterium]